MLCLPGVSSKDYARMVHRGGRVPALACPTPACQGERLRVHDRYKRYLCGVLTEVLRVRCWRCGVSHAVLPEDACAYRDVRLEAVEAALDAGAGHPTVAALAAGEGSTERGREAGEAPAVRRVRRWFAGFGWGFEQAVRALLPAAEGDWWERARAVFGASRGVLVRLRHWLWHTHRIFFGGPCGLFRRGRPCDAVCRGIP